MAVTLTTVFCFVNKRWIEMPPIDLYHLANEVAESKPEDHEDTLDTLRKIFRTHIRPLRLSK